MDSNVCLSFHNIRYEVEQKVNEAPCAKTTGKEILRNVSGLLSSGLNAIMGPTGSGKTSLLDVLAQRKDPAGLKEGVVLMNGKLPPDNFRLMSGYVVQDDIVMGTLTVKENLAFSANLRLPSDKFTAAQKEQKVEEVIDELGLQACKDTMVGTELVRGVSGGEKKRVNIGMEMILDPPVLFLDEPTTGLDSNTANSLVLLLYNLAQSGRNIIMSIHQPRYSIYSLFDRLILLNRGEIVYSGEAHQAVDFFQSVGYSCPGFNNPADFFLDVLGGDIKTVNIINRLNNKRVVPNQVQVVEDDEAFTGSELSIDEQNDGKKVSKDFQVDVIYKPSNNDCKVKLLDDDVKIDMEMDDEDRNLAQEFRVSNYAIKDNKELMRLLDNYKAPGEGRFEVHTKIRYANSFFHQLKAVTGRTVLNLVRNPMTSIVQTMVMLIFGTMIGSIYFKVDNSTQSGIQNRAGCFFFLVMSQVMSNVSALSVFIRNRTFYRHESASGYYRTSVYFISQVFADIIPNRMIPNFLFSLIIYFMIGFQATAAKFFLFVISLTMTALSAVSIAFMVSASVEVISVASILVSVPYILMMLFGGFLANVSTMLPWLEWVKYFSVFRYGLNALTINEMSGLVFIKNSSYPGFEPTSTDPCYSEVTNATIPGCFTGEDYMELQGIPMGPWGFLQNFFALFLFTFGFLCLAYIQLRRIKTFK